MAKPKISKSKKVTKATADTKSDKVNTQSTSKRSAKVTTADADNAPKNNKAKRLASKLRPRSPFRGYFIESWREIRRVKWPKRREAWKLTFAVIVFSVVFAAFLATLDFLFEKLAKVIFLR